MHRQTLERQRLAALQRYEILDTPEEEVFDQIASLLARLLDVPQACVTLVDRTRVFFKSRIGMRVSELRREPGLCASTIEDDGVRHIEDTSRHPELRSNSHVRTDGIRFYVGASLTTPDGFRIGTLCAFGRKPRALTATERELVAQLAKLTMHEIAARRDRRASESPSSILVVDRDPIIRTLISRAIERAGFQVLAAEVGKDARQQLAENRSSVSAVILDTSLGSDAAELHAVLAEAPDLKIILSGTRSEREAMEQFAALAPVAFLRKPFGPDELMRIVRAAVPR